MLLLMHHRLLRITNQSLIFKTQIYGAKPTNIRHDAPFPASIPDTRIQNRSSSRSQFLRRGFGKHVFIALDDIKGTSSVAADPSPWEVEVVALALTAGPNGDVVGYGGLEG